MVSSHKMTHTRETTLPGELHVDRHLVDQSVEQINQIYVEKGLETALAVGQLVLDTFFGGNVANFRTRERKHASFRELANRPGLQVSHTWVWRAVSVCEQLKLFDADVRSQLPYTHHTLLLSVKDTETKIDLANKATAESWSKRQLASEVSRIRQVPSAGPRTGRPPLPAYRKTINKFERMLNDHTDQFAGLDEIQNLDADDATRLRNTVVALLHKLTPLEKNLRDAAENVST